VRRLAVPGFLLACTLAVYAGPLLLGKTFLLRDHISFVTPSRTWLAHELAAGRFPEWWTAVGLGMPFAANPNHSALYPPMWLVAALPLRLGIDLVVIAHILAAALGGAALARRLGADERGAALAGAALLLSGYLSNMPPLCMAPLSFAWIPWIAWGADRVALAPDGRRRVMCALQLAALWAAEALSGENGAALDGGLLAGLIILARAPGWRARLASLVAAAAAAALAIAMAAALILPTLDLLARSDRASGLSVNDAAVWPLRPFRLVELVWPRPFGDPTEPLRDFSTILIGKGFGQQTEKWSVSEHIGAVVLVLAAVAVARRSRGAMVIAAGAVVLLVLSLGLYTPLYQAYLRLPLVRYLRYPEKHMVGVVIAVTALAGVGLAELARAPEVVRRRAGTAAGMVGTAIAAVALAATLYRLPAIDWLTAHAKDQYETMQLHESYLTALVGGYTAAASLFLAAASLVVVTRRPAAMWLTGAAAIAPCLLHAVQIQYLGDRVVLERTPALLAGEPPPTDPLAPPRVYRQERTVAHGWTNREIVYASHDSVVPNMGWPFGYASTPGYDPALDRRLTALIGAAETAGTAAVQRLAARLDIAYLVYPTDMAKQHGMAAVATAPDGLDVLVRGENRRPRAFVAPRWDGADDAAAQKALLDPAQPADLGLVHVAGAADARAATLAPGPATPCALSGSRPEELALRCDSPQGGYAVLADAWAPGWSATVDGMPAQIERADLVLRAVRVPPGPHEVRMSYRTPRLREGLWVSAAAWGMWALLLLGFGALGGTRR
jgi:membrane protein YfhO